MVFPLQHYSAIMKYISQPPLLLNVHMHNPTVSVRSWMDSLLAFFPGLQVLRCAQLIILALLIVKEFVV